MRSARSLDRVALALMLLCCASWGVQQVLAKLALAEVPPVTQAAIRSIGGTLIIGAWCCWRDPSIFKRDGTMWPGIATGMVFALEFLSLFLGLQWTSASRAALFLYTAPFFVALGAAFVLPQERLRSSQWVGLALSFIGVAIALGVSRQQGFPTVIGDVLALVAGALWAALTLIVKATRLRAAPAAKVLLYQLFVSAVMLVAVALAMGEKMPSRLSFVPAASLLYQSVWVAGFTYLVWYWLLRRYHSGEISAFTFVTPLIGVLAGYFLLGDALDAGLIVAVALVLGGIILVNRPSAPRWRSEALP
jgi:drug/metabolite transporter (DMT)-like permease